jgi:myosin V
MLSAAAVMAPAAATQKSSLEVLLETLKKRDEQPKDAPPTLPARPMCRGRLPTTRRPSLPAGFKLENGMVTVPATEAAVVDKKADAKEITGLEVKEEKTVKGCIFGTKRKFPSTQVLEESPYVDELHEERKRTTVCKEPPSVSPATIKMNGKPACTDIMDYVLKKVRGLFILDFVRIISIIVNLQCEEMEVI